MSDNQPLSGDIEWLLSEGEQRLFHQLAEISSSYMCRPSERETLRAQLEGYISQYNRLAIEKKHDLIPLDHAALFARDIVTHFFENRSR